MKKAFLVLVAAVAAIPGGFAVAQPTGGHPQRTTDRAHENAQVCRPIAVTGSLFSRRECRSAAEWAHLERQAQEALDDRRRNSRPN